LAIFVASFAVATIAGTSTSPATTLARELLNDALTPTNAVLAHPSTVVVCQCAGTPGVGTLTTQHRYFVVPGPPTALENFLTTHVPKGGRYDSSADTSTTSGGAGVISIVITFPANGPHVYLRQLAYSMTKRNSSTSWLRIDSQVVWLPLRSASQIVSGAVSATVTGYKTVGLMGSRGDVRLHLSGQRLTALVRELNALPLGPRSECMEGLDGFNVSITLSNGGRLEVVNGYCAGATDSVSARAGNLNEVNYVLSDRSCSFIKYVGSLFAARSVPGTSGALRQCETWSKSNAP
jgi:hypothetical protein